MTPEAALAHLVAACSVAGATHAKLIRRLRCSPLAESWLVEWAGARAVLRIDQPAAAAMGLDRAAEFERLQAVAAAGLGLAPIAVDPERGLLLRWYIEGSVWQAEDLRQAAKLEAIAGLLLQVHSAQIVAPPLDLGAAVDRYAGLAGPGSAGLAATTRSLLTNCRDLQAPLVFCHNDPVIGNFVAGADAGPGPGAGQETAGTLWLIDWEYSGFNEFWFDLAVVCGHHELPAALAGTFLRGYFRRPATAAELQRLAGWRTFYTSLARLWAAALNT
jgi:hypothetical protein